MILLKRIKCRDYDDGTWILVFYTGKDLHSEVEEGYYQGVVMFPGLEEDTKMPCILSTTTQRHCREVHLIEEALSFLHLRRKMGKPLKMDCSFNLEGKLIEGVKPKENKPITNKQDKVNQTDKRGKTAK